MNLLTILSKELEKGNTLLDGKGNFLTEEKAKDQLKKEYIAYIKAGKIEGSSRDIFELSQADYITQGLKKYYDVDVLKDKVARIVTKIDNKVFDIKEPFSGFKEPVKEVEDNVKN